MLKFKFKFKYLFILLILNLNSILSQNLDAINILAKRKTLKECFKDLVPDIVPKTPEDFIKVGVYDALRYETLDSEIFGDVLLHDMGPRDGEDARTYRYVWFEPFKHDYQTAMHIFVDGDRNQWIGHLAVNMGKEKYGTYDWGEILASDVFLHRAYPIYCEIFGNESVSYDIFLIAKQSNVLGRKVKTQIMDELIIPRSRFDLKKFIEEVPMQITHGVTVENYCNDSIKKNFFKNLLIGIIIMAAVSILMLGSTLLPLWKERHTT